MQNKSISIEEINEKYDLELDKILSEINKIKKTKEKLVLLQFPDGLKLYATAITNYLEEHLNKGKDDVRFLIWLGSCYGACDVPIGLEELKPKIDLIVQFGHSE